MVAPSRARYDGPVAETAAVLSPAYASPGWRKHAERGQGKGAVNGKAIMAAADVFRKLRGLHETWAFSQSMMQAACEQVLEAKNSEWCLAGKCLKEQPEVLAKRLRAACRHLSQAVMKGSKADWVLAVVGEAGARAEAKNADFVWYGWDAEQEVAWRSTEDHRSKEITRQLKEPPNACEADSMIAVWSDGDTWPIEEVLVGDWRRKVATLGALQADFKDKAMWKATHTASGLPVCIRFKPQKDRNDIVTLEWGPRQVCQVPVFAFPSHVAAAAWLQASGPTHRARVPIPMQACTTNNSRESS